MSSNGFTAEDGEESWGHLKPFENYGLPDKPDDFETIAFADSFAEPIKDYQHAAHAMLYTKITDKKLFGRFNRRATVMMQLRFDGYVGFPGGLIDPEDPSIVSGLNRELVEEAGLDDSLSIEASDHFHTEINHKKTLILHFFIKEVSSKDFARMERNVLDAKEYGFETLGVIRVPCYALPDKSRGLPIFLTNRFIGQARRELIDGLVHVGIFTRAEMDHFLELSNQFAANHCRSLTAE